MCTRNLELLEPERERNGLVLKLGCGSGLLTKYLVDAGHRVIATASSPAMLELAKEHAPGAADIRLLTMPDDPLPEADAVVSVGHAINYLDTEEEIERALSLRTSATYLTRSARRPDRPKRFRGGVSRGGR